MSDAIFCCFVLYTCVKYKSIKNRARPRRDRTEQTAAGYVLYGPATLLVYTAGDGVHSFVLDGEIGEFVLDHEDIRMPEKGTVVSANLCNYAGC